MIHVCGAVAIGRKLIELYEDYSGVPLAKTGPTGRQTPGVVWDDLPFFIPPCLSMRWVAGASAGCRTLPIGEEMTREFRASMTVAGRRTQPGSMGHCLWGKYGAERLGCVGSIETSSRRYRC
jgi:hypothetical protein